MVEFTDFEAELMRLGWVQARLGTIYEKYPIIIQEFKNQGKLSEIEIFTSIIRETIIVQLDIFNKVRENMDKNESRLKKIDSILESLWNPIKKYEKGITDYRNNYIAHIQQPDKFHPFIPFDTLSEEIIIKHKMPITFGHWMFLAGCVYYYVDFIKKYFRKEFDESYEKIKKHKKEKLSDNSILQSSITLNNFQPELKKIVKKIESNIKKQNLEF